MMSRNTTRRTIAATVIAGMASASSLSPLLIASAGLLVGITACSKPPEPPPPAPPPAPPPPKPEPVQIDPLRQAMKVDARVQFPQEKAPTSEDLARGILTLADALVRGDSAKLQGMLDPTANTALANLTSSGEWEESTGKIEAIRVVRVNSSGEGGLVTLAIQDPDGAYILNWSATKSGERLVFAGAPAADGVKPRASDWDRPGLSLDPKLASSGPAPTEQSADGDSARKSDEPKQESEDKPKEDDGNTTRHTPAGPVKIPTKGPGGG